MNLYQKIAAIMEAVPAIGNDKSITGSKASYNVATIQAVLKILRPLFVQHKLAFVPVSSEATVNGQTATLNGKYKLIDLDTGEFLDVAGSGAGYDPSDKHVGKASTYAYKTALLKMFCLATTDEDPDLFASDDNVNQEKIRKENAKKSAADRIKTKEALVEYIQDLGNRGKMEASQVVSFANKAMQIKDAAELASATAYFVGFDV